VAGACEPLAKLPQFPQYQHVRAMGALRVFADPEVARGLARMAEVGAEAQRLAEHAAASNRELMELGFPNVNAASCVAPYDYFADFLRGSKGIMLDMFRHKDKLLAAMEHVLPILIRSAVEGGTRGRSKIVFIPLHWGLDGFMSPQQFNTFYWPQLRRLIMGMIEKGVIPCVFWEGDCTSRLETIADIPRGKAIYQFERTDLFRAKQVLGNVVCLRGNVPASLLSTGTPEEVSRYCRRLIEGVGKNGGLLLAPASGIPDTAPTQNVVAMFRSVHEYQPG
jgi:uroporphyrinogen-III decarboxylase